MVSQAKNAEFDWIQHGTEGMERTVGHLQRAIADLNEAAFYFETIDMDFQRERIDAALDEAEAVLHTMGILLGRELEPPSIGAGYLQPKKSRKTMVRLVA